MGFFKKLENLTFRRQKKSLITIYTVSVYVCISHLIFDVFVLDFYNARRRQKSQPAEEKVGEISARTGVCM
jgi:hypothetical protein